MILHVSQWKDYRERNLISFAFPFLMTLVFIQIYVFAIATCVICFTQSCESIHSTYSVYVELICSTCIRRKCFVPVRSTTWTVRGHAKRNFYLAFM